MRDWVFTALVCVLASVSFFLLPIRGTLAESAAQIIECKLDYEYAVECMGKALRGADGAEALKAVIAEFAESEIIPVFVRVKGGA